MEKELQMITCDVCSPVHPLSVNLSLLSFLIWKWNSLSLLDCSCLGDPWFSLDKSLLCISCIVLPFQWYS